MTDQRPISVIEAESLINQHLWTLPAELCSLAEATGRILREEIATERPIPPFNRVMMDGIAIRSRSFHKGIRAFRIVGRVWPGRAEELAPLEEDACTEVMTGAVLPGGYDAVIPYEEVEMEGGRARVKSGQVVAGQNIHRKGSDAPAGTLILESGSVLDAPRVAAIAGCGRNKVLVSEQPLVAVISNGDELVPPGSPIKEHQVYAINNLAIKSLLERHGIRSVSTYHCGDDAGEIERVLADVLTVNDVLLISAGVSMGRKDLVPEVLEKLGVRRVFHRVRQRPGKPLYFGIREDHRLVFGLPGNPVSAMVCTRRYVLPALFRAMGARMGEGMMVKLARTIRFEPELTFFPPVRVLSDAAAELVAEPVDYHNSGHYLALKNSTGFVEIPCGPENEYPAGMRVRYFSWQMAAELE